MDRPQKSEIDDLHRAKDRLLSASREVNLRSWIRKNPTKAVGGALAAGFISGSSSGFQGKVAETAANTFIKEWFKKHR